MTIKEFIAELQKYPNQNATINFVVMNEDKEVLREMQVGGRHQQCVNIGLMLKKII